MYCACLVDRVLLFPAMKPQEQAHGKHEQAAPAAAASASAAAAAQ